MNTSPCILRIDKALPSGLNDIRVIEIEFPEGIGINIVWLRLLISRIIELFGLRAELPTITCQQ